LNVQTKNVLKHDRNRVQHIDFRMQLLLVVIVVSDVSDVKVMSSAVAVIFAITRAVNNYNIRTELYFLNRPSLVPTEVNSTL